MGGDEPTEHEILIEEVINIHDDTGQKAEEATTEASEKDKADREAALDVRQTAMEHMSETAERKKTTKGKERPPKRSTSDTIEFLIKKLEMDRENKKFEREAQENQNNMQNQMFANLLHSQQQMMAQQMLLMQEIINQKIQKDSN